MMAIKRGMNLDLYRTVILTVLAGIAVLVVSLANRNVYAKEEIDYRFRVVQEKHETAYTHTCERINELHTDVRWIIQKMGGKDDVNTQQDSNSP